jgi:hypothetical protein
MSPGDALRRAAARERPLRIYSGPSIAAGRTRSRYLLAALHEKFAIAGRALLGSTAGSCASIGAREEWYEDFRRRS